MYYEADADSTVVRDREIAIVGYGKQGRALNLRDSGYDVRIGNRPGGYADFAHAYGVASGSIAEAADWASILGLITSAFDLLEDGRFARDWAIEQACGRPHVCRLRRQALDHPLTVTATRAGWGARTGRESQ